MPATHPGHVLALSLAEGRDLPTLDPCGRDEVVAGLLRALGDWLEQGQDEPVARALLRIGSAERALPGVREQVAAWLHDAGERDVSAWLCHHVKPGYRSRLEPEYFRDTLFASEGLTHQPDIYPFAAHLARRHGCTHLIDLGCGAGAKLIPFAGEFSLVGVDHGENLERCRAAAPGGTWLAWDLEDGGALPIEPAIVRRSVIICSDVIEHLRDPGPLLHELRRLLEDAPVAVLSTPERHRVRGVTDMGPPANPAHVREWALDELRALVRAYGLEPVFSGLTVNNDRDREKKTSLVVLSGRPFDGEPPAGFRVVAFMTCYNEVDILGPSIEHLLDQDVDVHLVDNWSNDGSYELASRFAEARRIGLERFPSEGPTGTYDWRDLLGRIEQLAVEMRTDWFVHHDVDERRSGPWPGLDLRRSLYRVDRAGFNAVDHTVLVFHPVDDGYRPGSDYEACFGRFEFGRRPGHFEQVKAWKATGAPVSLGASGGHQASFPGRRIFPFSFLLKHYPVRSQAHGERKVLRERQARWNAGERARGWHTHYDHVGPDHRFVRDAAQLEPFDEEFFERCITERLSGVGIVRPDRPAEP